MLICYYSLDFGSILKSECPNSTHPKTMPQDGVVRGEVKIAGWKIKAINDPKAGGLQRTALTYIVQSDIKGNLPAAIVNTVAQQQAFLIAAVEKELNKITRSTQFDAQMELSNAALITIADEINRGHMREEIAGSRLGDDNTGKSEEVSIGSNSGYDRHSEGDKLGYPMSLDKSVISESSAAASESMLPGYSKEISTSTTQGQTDAKSLSPLTKPQAQDKSDSMGQEITSRHLAIMLLPSFCWFIITYGFDSPAFGSTIFCMTFVLCAMHLIEIALGRPTPKRCLSSHWGAPVTGSAIFRFPIELKRLLRYIESKRKETGIEINVTHVTMKAAAMALQEMPSLNGHICMNRFYKSQTSDISYVFPLASGGSQPRFTSVVVHEAESKAVSYYLLDFIDIKSRICMFTMDTANLPG